LSAGCIVALGYAVLLLERPERFYLYLCVYPYLESFEPASKLADLFLRLG
jgi:hypothetical protein